MQTVMGFLLHHYADIDFRYRMCGALGRDLFPPEMLEQMNKYLVDLEQTIDVYERTGEIDWNKMRKQITEVMETHRTYLDILELEEANN